MSRFSDLTLEGAVAPERPVAPEGAGEVRVRFWGTRGSIPSPGPATARFGGNTSCVQIRLGERRRVILDAGSGLRALGHALVSGGGPLEETVFLTHFHWDHIQGFPFFAPLYDPDARVRIVAPQQGGEDARTLFAGQMGPVYFPVPFDALSARLEFEHLNEGIWESDGFRVRAQRARHPSFTVGYRVEVGGWVITYVPDNELAGGGHDVGDGWAEQFDAFVRGSHVLVHDSMYTTEEYERHRGWGHSTFDQSIDLAVRTGVPRLFFFHHSPERTDTELERLVDQARARVRREGHALDVHAADEGEDIVLPIKQQRP